VFLAVGHLACSCMGVMRQVRARLEGRVGADVLQAVA
jgi:formate hydrogenlyase subunit 4